jgi:large repetitive protein
MVKRLTDLRWTRSLAPLGILFLAPLAWADTPAFVNPFNPFGIAAVVSSSTFAQSSPELADIDGDGDLDAFVGDHLGNLQFSENYGTAAIPAFAPPVVNPFGLTDAGSWAVPDIVDIDSDGDLDVFVGVFESGRTMFFENVGTASSPQFAGAQINPFGLAGVQSFAAPVLADIDADGDLDALIGNFTGYDYLFENTGTASAPAFGPGQENPLGLIDVGMDARPDLVDIDGDGDLDAFVGRDGDTAFFENTGTPSAPAFGALQSNPFGLALDESDISPHFADVDGDGDLDGLFGAHSGRTIFFENVGTANVPAFLPPPAIEPFGLVNIGSPSIPSLADIDDDGDLDAFFGEGDADDTLFSENVGTAAAPSFGPLQVNPFGLAPVSFTSGAELADLDGDGDLDALIGFPDIRYIENTGTPSAPAFASPQLNPFGLGPLSLSSHSLELVDIDGDGDLDALILSVSAKTISFFENVGTPTAPSFASPETDPFGLSTGSFDFRHLELADVEGDGDLDAFIGQQAGDTLFYENLGTANAPAFAPPQVNALGLVDVGGHSAPAFGDLDGDGDLDGLFGSSSGDTLFFENRSIPPQCLAAPAPGCTTGFLRPSLIVSERVLGREKVLLKLFAGPGLAQTAFGDPTAFQGTAYALCLYDDASTPVGNLQVPPGRPCSGKDCWESKGGAPPTGSGFNFKDAIASFDGVTSIRLRSGNASSLLVKAQNKASRGQTAMPTGIAASLASSASVTVQVQTSDAACFSATLSDFVKQQPTFIKVK